MEIFCVGCGKEVDARLTSGAEIYPHRPDLAEIPMWKCDTCKNYVGCHWKSNDPRTHTKPLGCIPTKEIMEARKKIHALLDPLWKTNKIKRGKAYAYIGKRLGKTYHNGELSNMEDARNVYQIVVQLHNELISGQKQLPTP